jgi:hypothetical protein
MASLHPWEYFFINSLTQVSLHCNQPFGLSSFLVCQAEERGSTVEVGFARLENRPFKDFSAMPAVMVDLKKKISSTWTREKHRSWPGRRGKNR